MRQRNKRWVKGAAVKRQTPNLHAPYAGMIQIRYGDFLSPS
jgi:hypothetical protein